MKKIIVILFFGLSLSSVASGQWGSALHFNWWERDRAEVLDAPYIWPPQMPTGTVEMWFKPDTILAWNTHDPNYTFLFGKNYSGNNAGDFGADWQEQDGRLHFFVENGEEKSSCYSDSTIIPFFEPRWYHFAATWNVNTGTRVFLDGIMHPEKGSANALPVEAGDQIFVIGDGSIDHFNDRYETFRGSIDEFRVSTVVRYTENFAVPTQPFEVDANTLALWHFDEGEGVFAFDATGNGFDAHLGGHREGPFSPVDTLLTKPDWVAVEQTQVNQNARTMPVDFILYQNYPNPFNPETSIAYELPRASHVLVEIFDVLGNNITTLVDEYQNFGRYSVTWDGRDFAGNLLPTGVYVYRIQVANFEQTKKMVIMR